MKVNIIKFDHFGRGLGKLNKKVIFIPRALPEEVIDASVTNEKKNYLEGEIKSIIEKSNNRIEPLCPFYNQCGGCNFLHTTYTKEKEFKINKAIELLGKCDNFYETKELNYRNKITLHIKDNKIGLYEEKTKMLVNIDYCYLENDNINKVIKVLNEIDLSKYSFNQIIIKSNQNSILLDFDEDIDDDIIEHFSFIDTIIANKKVIKGKGFIEEIIANRVFKITPNAFFQVNCEGLGNIYLIIKDFLKDKKIESALDLYSGTSLWSILISDYVKNITSIEINKEACLNALDNIKNNNINNVQVINGDVANYIDTFSNIDLVIVDPPRSGLDKKTKKYLKRINSEYIIYISCDMQTLKRDLDELKDNYNTLSINLVDMFKRTYHCESIVVLERK